MAEDYKEIFAEINDIKTKLAVMDYFIASFKEQDTKTIEGLESLKQRLNELETKVYTSVKDIEYKIESKIGHVENKIDEVNSTIKSNTFLEFTSSMGAKQWGILIAIITTVLSTIGSIDSIVGNSSSDRLLDQIETLVELGEE